MLSRTQKPVSFDSVLNNLCIHGKDVLVDTLQSDGCLKQARLANRALRETVDSSLRYIRVDVQLGDAQRVVTGQRFPLRRFPRLHRLEVTRHRSVSDSEYKYMALPFMGQPMECLQRITEITLDSLDYREASVEAAAALSALIYRMPNLRCVRMGVDFSQEPLQQLVLFDALVSLTQLEELQLEHNFSTQQMGALAGRLKKLTMYGCVDNAVSEFCAIVAQMPALELAELTIDDLGNHDSDAPALAALAQFLRRPPPRLRALRLNLSCIDGAYWNFNLASGRLVEVEQSYILFEDVAHITREVLLPLGLRLDKLSLEQILAQYYDHSHADDDEPHLQALHALCQRSCSVHIGIIELDFRLGLSRGRAVLRALGTPHELWVYNDDIGDIRIDLHKLKTTPQECDGLHGSSLTVRGIALASELLVQWLAAPADLPAEKHLGRRRQVHVVLLRSPLFSGLPWSPAALHAWMVGEEQAATAPDGYAPAVAIKRYLPVPTVGAVVLECAAAKAAVATAAVAQRAMAAAGFSQGAVVLHTFKTRGFHVLLTRVLQAFWDSGQGGSEAERLELLMEMAFALQTFMTPLEEEEESEEEEEEEA